MMDKFDMTARRLMEASAEDRAWVLAQLAAEDRIRVVAMLRDTLEESSVVSGPVSVIDSSEQPGSASSSESLSKLATVDAQSMGRVLAPEPAWLIALLVRDARWPWVEGFLESLDPIRLESIERHVQRGRSTVKPELVNLVCRLVAEKLTEEKAQITVPSSFEAMLARVRTRLTSDTPSREQVRG